MANLTWALAKLALRHERLYSAIEHECQQKLWHFSPQNLVNVAWAFAKVLLVRRSFFEELGTCATQLAPDFNPQNCSNAVWAFAAAMASGHGPLLAAVAQRATRLAPELGPQDLANLSWAFAKLSRRDQAFEETMASEVLRKVKSCSPQHLSIIAYSFAQMMAASGGREGPEDGLCAPSAARMVEVVLDTALQRVREFDAQGLTNLAQSLAKLEIQNDSMLDALIQEAGPKISTFSNQELAMLAWATARLGRFQGRALRLVAQATKHRLGELTPQDVSVLVWSFARSGMFEEDLADEEVGVKGKKDSNLGTAMLKTLTETILRLIPDLTPQDLSTIIWGYATRGVDDNPELIEAVADEAVGKMAHFAPQDMANVAWGLAKLGLLHEELFQVLSKDLVRRIDECQAQHLSIAAWSFAKLGAASPKLFWAIGQALSMRAEQLDPQGVGNSLWAFAVLCFWHEPFVQALGRRAVRSFGELTAQEMANVAFGLRTLLCWRRQSKDPSAENDVVAVERLLRDFLCAASSSFCRKAMSEGASWTDFANVAKAVAEETQETQELTELEAHFRALHLEPLFKGLEHLQRGEANALQQLQEVLDEASTGASRDGPGGVPHLGEVYSAEALCHLGLNPRSAEGEPPWSPGAQAVPEWIDHARQQCRESNRVWQIPATDSVIAHVCWDVSYMENTWRNTGRVYHAASQRAQARGVVVPNVAKHIEELLAPLRQHLRRDSHPERLALLELLSALEVECGEEQEVSLHGRLQRCEGHVRIYVSQYPCVSCLAVFCQFRRWCPQIQMEVAFDNAWTSFCGRPRNRV
ncbi:unnamed protein product [Durusdinium trenchii]|uniref:RNA-editing substrate-binding complex 6 protein domain-containing protein n=1 Tax=Durusdinium trenchii TaxID=1381693 RepID=A0ABP0SYW5_9DINO